MKAIECHVDSISPFSDTVFQVRLTPQEPFDFVGGQYLTIVMGPEDKRPFSIASAPGSKQIELHIGAFVAESYAMQVIEHLRSNTRISIEAPFGHAHLRLHSRRPRLLVVGGTGFSYAHSMLEQLVAIDDNIPTILYWGCRDNAGMYLRQRAEQLADSLPSLTFVPVFDEWQAGARHGSVLDAVCDDIADLSDYDIYVAGRFEMAGVARERFLAQGANSEHLIGDAFAYLK
ncbi:NAD(P)H-flavin reductase [Ferrimonas senticii]|uniref:NAD(P)H-flavin reductase n=1 Tax=Ferrimonas senticii TaxID=394566 RepID=UPI000424FCC9|nr:NAD(P)H-flavin reductase [Ferrimonas senticii]